LKILMKLGGTLLDDAATRESLARQLAEISRQNELVVVHGGGKQVTRYLEERGVSSRFVGGLRVSDEAVVEAVIQVIAGGVNKRLVSAVIAAGEAAVGLSGVDGCLTTATRLDPALGFVGKPAHTDGRLLDLLVNAGYVPVVACVAGDRQGSIYNVNADSMAVSCALGWGAAQLFFLTDVPGVKGADNTVLANLDASSVADLISSGVATGGMQAKLEAALLALNGGTSEVVIAAGREESICRRLVAGERTGTRIGSVSGR
jgi:acetylglutamate kinase